MRLWNIMMKASPVWGLHALMQEPRSFIKPLVMCNSINTPWFKLNLMKADKKMWQVFTKPNQQSSLWGDGCQGLVCVALSFSLSHWWNICGLCWSIPKPENSLNICAVCAKIKTLMTYLWSVLVYAKIITQYMLSLLVYTSVITVIK